MSDVFGKPNYNSGGRKTYFKVKEGQDQILRILPPYGSQRASGKWALFYNVQFGYKDLKGHMRPFESCEVVNRTTKMIEVEDAASTKVKKLKAEFEKAKAENNTSMMDRLKPLTKQFNTEKKWYMLAVDLQGKIGILSLPHKHKLALQKEIDTLRAKGVDPVGVENGRFFVFSKSGNGPQTIHGVREYKDSQEVTVNGKTVKAEIDLVHNLMETDIPARMGSEAADLGALYKKPTPEQIRQMVEGGAASVQTVMDSLNGNQTSAAEEIVEDPEEEEETVAQPVVQQVSQPVQQAVQQPVTQQAPVVAAQVFGNTGAAPVKTAVDVSKLSDEEFNKMMGLN